MGGRRFESMRFGGMYAQLTPPYLQLAVRKANFNQPRFFSSKTCT
jgi:hypothetical protein